MAPPLSVWRLTAALVMLPATVLAQGDDGWPLHGHDLGGQRFSPLASIDTATVAGLRPGGPTIAA